MVRVRVGVTGSGSYLNESFVFFSICESRFGFYKVTYYFCGAIW